MYSFSLTDVDGKKITVVHSGLFLLPQTDKQSPAYKNLALLLISSPKKDEFGNE